MRIQKFGSLVSFSEVEPGGLMILQLWKNFVTHAMKAVVRNEDRDDEEFIIVLGPFSKDEHDDAPITYPVAHWDHARHVLRLAENHVLVPSVAWQDLNFEPSSGPETLGEIVITQKRDVLRVVFDPKRRNRPAYVDIASGEFVKPDSQAPAVSTKRWCIVRQIGELEETVLEFTAAS